MKTKLMIRTSWLILVVMLLSIGLKSTVEASVSIYTDIRVQSKLYAPLVYLQEKGIMKGYGDGSFRPQEGINRAEALKIIYESRGLPVGSDSRSGFSDVPEEEWYANYVTTAKKTGIIQGYPDGTYRPTQYVNRVEFIKMALSAQPYFKGASDSEIAFGLTEKYGDLDSGQWYMGYLSFAQEKGFLQYQGKRNNTFRPGDTMTRGDAAYMIYLISQYNQSLGFDEPKGPEQDDITSCTEGEYCANGIDLEKLLGETFDSEFLNTDGDEVRIGNFDFTEEIELLKGDNEEIKNNIKDSIQSALRSASIRKERETTPPETKHKVEEVFPEWYDRALSISGGIQSLDDYLDRGKSSIVDKEGELLNDCDCGFERAVLANYNGKGYELPFEEWRESDIGKEKIYDLILRYVR